MRDEKKFKLSIWSNFIDKTKKHATMPVKEWTEYQFLGYFCQEAGYNLQPGKESAPRYHVQLEEIRNIMMYLCGKVKMYETKSKKVIPEDFNRQIVKDYLDFCLKKFKNKKFKIHTPRIFNTLEHYQKFENRAKKSIIIDRSTELPEEIKLLVQKMLSNKHIHTFGELAFVHGHQDKEVRDLIKWEELLEYDITPELIEKAV